MKALISIALTTCLLVFSSSAQTPSFQDTSYPEDYTQAALSSIFLVSLFEGKRDKIGTGFIIKPHKRYYLITCWHFVSGGSTREGAIVSSDQGNAAEQLEIYFWGNEGNSEHVIIDTVSLKTESGLQYRPAKVDGQLLDAVAIPLDSSIVTKYNFNLVPLPIWSGNLQIEPSDKIIVPGFPDTISLPPPRNPPIGQGSILAPLGNVIDDQKQTLDLWMAGMGGMSGAPVFRVMKKGQSKAPYSIKDFQLLGIFTRGITNGNVSTFYSIFYSIGKLRHFFSQLE